GDAQLPIGPNVEQDADLPHQAGWRLWLGTVAEMRIPSLGILPSHSAAVRAAWLDADLGSRYIGDTGLDQMADDVDQVLDYYAEAYDATEWRVQLSGSPGRAYDVAVWEDPLARALRWDSRTSTLAADAAAGATSLSVAFTGVRWVRAADDAASLPFDIEIQGRQIHVTAVSGTTSPQTFTVDPIPSDLTAGKTVRLWHANRLAL
ncbi:MAG TPA: hypothetical protein VHA75_13105, partial [Rugosimonospora sp.]|nr:hypothetical protein [Rugosimonospora sp.]